MQFTAVIVALFAAVAMAAPAAEPVAEAVPDKAAANYCTPCKNEGQSCCSLTACYVYSC
jgi:hypothetical protein